MGGGVGLGFGFGLRFGFGIGCGDGVSDGTQAQNSLMLIATAVQAPQIESMTSLDYT